MKIKFQVLIPFFIFCLHIQCKNIESSDIAKKSKVTKAEQIRILRSLYLELMKNTILNMIYEPELYKEDGGAWPKIAHSMIGKKRMNNIQFCIEDVLENNIPGDFIETGVWRGGAVIFMRAALKAYNVKNRIVWAADSFDGLPPADPTNYPIDISADYLHDIDYLKVSLEQVQAHFDSYGLLDDQVKFLKGYFRDSMPNSPIKKLAILRLDGDMYESTIEVLDNLYDKLSIGGYVIIDDYDLHWANMAVRDFRKARGITEPIIDVDGRGAYWKNFLSLRTRN